MKWVVAGVSVLLLLAVVAAGLAVFSGGWIADFGFNRSWEYYEVERTDYTRPPRESYSLTDDRLQDKTPSFDPELVDSRPLNGWEVNQSEAVTELDCPLLKPDDDKHLLALRPSFADVAKSAKARHENFLPSANLLDAAAKQFDDGLYAALDLGVFEGRFDLAPSAPEVVDRVLNATAADSPARPFLAAALALAGRSVDLDPAQQARRDRWLTKFNTDAVLSKPISFYTWSDELGRVWRFFRFLQHEFPPGDLQVPQDIAAALDADAQLLEQYRAVNDFYGRLTNPLICLPVDALIGAGEPLQTLAQQRGARHPAVAVFPPSTSREAELFEAAFPQGPPPGANLMGLLIRQIRSGEVDLSPGPSDGWYQHQVYALETLLLPSKGRESEKLLLTAEYKRRLIEAFKAMMTKRRETHARQAAASSEAAAIPLEDEDVRPRLRIEPCATYYLRTGRAYAFLQNVLTAAIGEPALAKSPGLTESGARELPLGEELEATKRRFYGFYLISCEDIGLKPALSEEELVDRDAARKAALTWLQTIDDNPDLAQDTRVSVPIFVSPTRGTTRLWATLGVRLARLDASFATPPKVRPQGETQWQDVERRQLGDAQYVIAVDEHAEVELPGARSLTRAELRAICDRHETKAAIVKALQTVD